MEERIIKLETLAAMQDGTIEKLNEELFRQQQDIARLQRHIDTIKKKVAELNEPDPIAGNERPPHY
ncbi:MAG: SlyX family protein [Verrucomicrobiota bacterium]